MSIVIAQTYVRRTSEHEQHSAVSIPFVSILITMLLVVAIGFRPNYRGFVDMFNYNEWFYHLQSTLPVFRWDWSETNIIFSNLLAWCAKTFPTPTEFYLINAFIYFGGIFIACRRMFPGNTLAALLTYLGALSTFAYAVNGVKAGVAAVIFLLALTFYNRKWIMLALALISIGFHHSMILCFIGLIVAFTYSKPQFYLWIWVLCFFISMFHITAFQEIFASFSDDSRYLSETNIDTSKGLGGFRIDFILYSFVPIAIGIYAIFIKQFKSEVYNFLLSLYLIINSVWLLCMYANFNNRIAYLSWLMLPIVLIYPVLHPIWGEGRFKSFNWIMLGHLSFTLFMTFIYYG